MHLKVTIVSTLDTDSTHTMSFIFVVLHVPCFKPTHVISLKCICFIYLCLHILNPNACILFSHVYMIWCWHSASLDNSHDLIKLLYISCWCESYCLHAYCHVFLRTGLQGRPVCTWLVIHCINVFTKMINNKLTYCTLGNVAVIWFQNYDFHYTE